jgi:hypothetical protein
VIMAPYLASCKDRKQLAQTKYDRLPGRGSYILGKNRCSMVVRKDSSIGRLYMHPTYTFSEMTPAIKREQVLTD